MSHSLVATLPVQSGRAARFFRFLLSTLCEARARRAREEIARHAALIASAREHRLIADARAGEPRRG